MMSNFLKNYFEIQLVSLQMFSALKKLERAQFCAPEQKSCTLLCAPKNSLSAASLCALVLERAAPTALQLHDNFSVYLTGLEPLKITT